MAFASDDLGVITYANGFTLWHYVTEDPAATVDTAGYFNAAANMLRPGDMIMANLGGGAAGLLLVSSIANGVVDTSDMTTVGAANTD